MRLYLSSYRVSDRPEVLRAMTSGKTVGVVCNALDHVDASGREQYVSGNRDELEGLGIATTELDLRRFFGDATSLGHELERLGAVWVCGGNPLMLECVERESHTRREVQSVVGPGSSKKRPGADAQPQHIEENARMPALGPRRATVPRRLGVEGRASPSRGSEA